MIHDPEAELGGLCEFLGLTWTEEMLDFHRDADIRVPSYGVNLHRHLAEPITPGLRDWTESLSTTQQHLVQAACGPALVELGYVTGAEPLSWRAAAAAIRGVDALRTAPRHAHDLLHPSRRMY